MPALLLLLGCVVAAVDPAPPSPAPPVDPVVAELPPSPPLLSPSELSPAIESRIEGPWTANECMVDTDCMTAGCASEVCVAGTRVREIITTCEVLPVFSELSSCGCQGGVCKWTRRPGARELGSPRTLPVPVFGGGGGT